MRLIGTALAWSGATGMANAMQFAALQRGDDGEVAIGCDEASRLVFSPGKTSDNSLGGRGGTPWKPASIRFGDVLPHSYKHVDMIVTALSTYFGNEDGNKAEGDFALINVNAGANVSLKFNFVDRFNGVPVTLDPFYFTVANIGRFSDQSGGAKGFSMSGDIAYTLTDDTAVEVVEEADEYGTVTRHFMSSFEGVRGKDRVPHLVANMTTENLANSVVFSFPAGTSDFEMTLIVKPGVGDRSFSFGGASNAVCEGIATCAGFECPQFYQPRENMEVLYCAGPTCIDEIDVTTCCKPLTPDQCTPGNKVSFSSDTFVYGNLGGFNDSLPRGIKFHNVFFDAERPIDLMITNMSQYTPGPAKNGNQSVLFGQYVKIDLMHDTSVVLAFEFQDIHGNSVELPTSFSIAIFDFDTQDDGQGIEELDVEGFESYSLSGNTTIRSFDQGDGSATFIATVPGNLDDNPANPLNQTEEQLAKTVTFEFAKSTNSFRMTARVNGGYGGRQFLISGWSATECPELGSYCTTMECPTGYLHRDDESLRCAGAMCGPMDFDTCCEPRRAEGCAAHNRVQFTVDSLVVNNLDSSMQDGSPPIMRVMDIFPQSKRFAQMTVSVTGRYKVAEPVTENNGVQNGLLGGFLKIDVLGGQKVHLNFDIIDMKTNMLLPSTFHLTVVGLEATENGKLRPSVRASDYDYYNISSDAKLKVETFDNDRGVEEGVFSGLPATHTIKSLPSSPLLLQDKHLTRAVSFHYTGKSSVQLELAASGGGRYRSFYVGGSTRLACPTNVAFCSSLVCPDSYRLKSSAASLSCVGRVCRRKDDLDTCCEKVDFKTCDPSTAVMLSEENLVVSNLGGLGPDRGTQALVFSNVFPNAKRLIDLEVVNMTPYRPHNPKNNGMYGGFGSISLRTNSETDFEFRLIDRELNQTVKSVTPFDFSFMNLLADVDPATGMLDGAPSVRVPEAQDFILTDRTFLHREHNNFTAMAHGGLTTPRQPMELDIGHMHSSVALKLQSPVFHAKMTVSGGNKGERRLLFSGPSNLACPFRAFCSSHKCPDDMVLIRSANSTFCAGGVCTPLDTPTCCRYTMCDPEFAFVPGKVNFSNLGGYGPDVPAEGQRHPRSIIYENCFPYSGKRIDLVVSLRADSEYYPNDASRNGIITSYGIINMRSGSSSDLAFGFFDEDGVPAKVPNFFMTFSGIDQQKEMGVEHLTVYKSLWHKTADNTALSKEEGDDYVTFSSTRVGGVEGSRVNPMDISGDVLNHTVTFAMPTLESFHVRLSSDSGWTGRNTLFAGPSSLVCGRKASCASMSCEPGYTLKSDSFRLTCASTYCYKDRDHDNCCTVVSDPIQNEDEPQGSTDHGASTDPSQSDSQG